jgi:hypothetical protein
LLSANGNGAALVDEDALYARGEFQFPAGLFESADKGTRDGARTAPRNAETGA